MSEVAIFSFGRVKSERCPNKMLRPFAGTTLTDIVLEKLASLDGDVFFAGYEDEFQGKCQKHKVRFVQRDERSAAIDEPITDILSFLKEIDAEHFMIVSGCLPFLTVAQIQSFHDQCLQAGRRPGISVRAHRSHFLKKNRTPVNFDISRKTLNTKTLDPVYEIVGALFFFNKEFFFKHGKYWDLDDVMFIELAEERLMIDIDTEQDFVAAETLWAHWPK